MTDSKPKNKKLIIASGFAAAAILAAAAVFFLPYAASAQQMMNPAPYWNGFERSSMGNMYSSANHTNTMLMPNITGSINVPKLLNDQVKVVFSDAAKTAESQVDGGKVVGGHIGIVQGYLVYSFKVANPDSQTSYIVIVDAGNGKVLYKSEGFHMGSMGDHFGFGGAPFGMVTPGEMMWKHHFG